MLLRLVSPVRRNGSSILQFVQRIPADVWPRSIGTRLEIPLGDGFVTFTVTDKTPFVRFSLRTRDPGEAKARQGAAIAYLEQAYAALRSDAPVALSHRQATALAGELYRAWTLEGRTERRHSATLVDGVWIVEEDEESDGEGEQELYASVIAHLDRVKESGKPDALEMLLGAIVDRLLAQKGILRLTPASRTLCLDAFWLALRQAMEVRQLHAEGDYRPDPKAERFPEFTPAAAITVSAPKAAPSGKVTLTSLVEEWWTESKAAGLKPSTYEGYRNTVVKLVGFLRHDDALRVTPEDIVRFKEWRLATPHPRTGRTTSPRTVKDADLAGLKSVFGYGVRNRKLPSNPAEGITIKLGKQKKLRATGFEDDEVKALLSASARLAQGSERLETYGAKRWIPWILAYTGARVGEIAQLRKQDLHKTGDHWSIIITPEAGTVKGNEPRTVPLHPHLVESGFVAFVQAAPEGHLFLRPNKLTGDVLGPMKGVKNRVREFVRKYVQDPNVQPNHAWRHLFMTRCRAAGVDHELRRMITGHAGEGVDEKVYGDPAGLYREICKLPRFGLE